MNSFTDLLKKYQTDFETSQAVIAQQNIQFQQNFDRQQNEFNAVLENERKGYLRTHEKHQAVLLVPPAVHYLQVYK